MLLVNGIGHVGSFIIGFAYFSEHLQSSHLPVASVIVFIFDGISIILPVLYF